MSVPDGKQVPPDAVSQRDCTLLPTPDCHAAREEWLCADQDDVPVMRMNGNFTFWHPVILPYPSDDGDDGGDGNDDGEAGPGGYSGPISFVD